jgi:outer membrane lipoprotein-sorting protein
MGELGEVLELLYGARLRFRTARGTVAYRHSNALVHEAGRRWAERSRNRSRQVMFAYASSSGEQPPDLREERTRFWWQAPERLREEVETAPHGPRTVVLDGELWWLWTPDHGAISNVDLPPEERASHRAGGGERFRPLLDPSGLLAALEFVSVDGSGERIVVRARLRDDREEGGARLYLPVVGGADEYVLEVERTSGVVRRFAAFLDGREAAVTELTELALDEELPDETFTFRPPPGVEVLPPESYPPRRFTLEEAAAEAPFAVFAIPELPDGIWRLHVHYSSGRRHPPVLFLSYHRADGRGSVSLGQRPAGEESFGWRGLEPHSLETVERGGVELTLARADPDRGSHNGVALERDGTALQLQSQEVDLETLIGLALSLEPVSAASA